MFYRDPTIAKSDFNTGKTLSIDTATYPIILADVKLYSEWYRNNPTDTTQDAFVSNILIKQVINSWEQDTKFYILDQTRQAFLQDDIVSIDNIHFTMGLNALNVYSVDNIKYYPYDWDYIATKTILDVIKYFVSIELPKIPIQINLKPDYVPLFLYNIISNIEVNYKAGYQSNNFVSIPQDIKDCLTMMVANALDVKKGYCDDFWKGKIQEIVSKYKIVQNIIDIV